MTTTRSPLTGGLAEWIARRADRRPDDVAIIDAETGEELSYGDFFARIRATAEGLRGRGVRRGDRVMLIMENRPEFLEYLFATAALGAVAVPVNFRLSAPEIAYLIDDAQPTVLVHGDLLAGLATDAVAAAGLTPPQMINVDVAPVGEGLAGEMDLDPVSDDDVCLIMYTSGTTGFPKGAMITHGHMRWNVFNMVMVDTGVNNTDVTLCAAPLFHIGALSLLAAPLLYVGGTVVLQRSFVPAETLRLFEKHRVSVCFLVPAMWAALSQVPTFDDVDVSAMRFVMSGGAPTPLPVIRFFLERGWAFLEGFGMTEFGPAALLLDNDHIVSHAGTVGRPATHVDAAVVDEADRPVAPGEIGELVLRGPVMFAGYWGLPQATASTQRGGWMHTGDLARMDADGFVSIVDRKKDMVISGGENVYPAEVEQMLHQHPGVTDVAVIGVPDETWGETVAAVVVPAADAAVTEAELIDYCRSHIAHFKAPKAIHFAEELPRTATGKLLKRVLRQTYTGSGGAVTR
ncbi:long-chain fatty acid--CoA ligase [Gordonia sinesedis]